MTVPRLCVENVLEERDNGVDGSEVGEGGLAPRGVGACAGRECLERLERCVLELYCDVLFAAGDGDGDGGGCAAAAASASR